MQLRYIARTWVKKALKPCYWEHSQLHAPQMRASSQCATTAAVLGLACAACLFATEGAAVSAYSDPRNNICPSADWRVRSHPYKMA